MGGASCRQPVVTIIKNFRAAAQQCLRQSFRIYWVLLRISLPLLVAIRLLDEHFGLIAVVGEWLAPAMALVGLPGAASIVWATGIFLNLYAAMLVLPSLWLQLELSAAQATVLAVLLLTAHGLPVELRIVQKAGVNPWAMLAVRMGGALLIGTVLHAVYTAGDWLQYPATLHFVLPPAASGWGEWLAGQAQNWLLIYPVILLLVVFVRLLKATHAEQLLIVLLSPLLRRMGIGEQATTTTLIGMTLGLSYGGALLIDEARRGDINRRDMLCALTLLCLCHSVVEDTLAMMLIGGHISGVLVARIVFSFLFMVIFSRIIRRLSNTALFKFMLIAR